MFAFLLIAVVTVGSQEPVEFRYTSMQRFSDLQKCLDAGVYQGDRILRAFDETKFKIKTSTSCELQTSRDI